jgi:Fur family transcriptional regulator, ferric uptake regulator
VTKRKISKRESPPSTRPLQELRTVLKDAGLRKTAPRVAVLQQLEGASSPLSHGDIAETLAPLGFDRATVYRNLIDLTDAGLVSRSDLGDHVWRFELKTKQKGHVADHPHFVCVDCGDVSCLPDSAIRIVSSRGVPRALGAHAVEVQVKGRCDECGDA